MPDWIISSDQMRCDNVMPKILAAKLEKLCAYATDDQLAIIKFMANDNEYILIRQRDFIEWVGWDSEQKKQSVPKTNLSNEIKKWKTGIERLANSMWLEGEDYK